MPDSTCTVDGCEAAHYSRGMCKPHYRKDYYLRNKARENASNKAYREARPEYWKERWQEYYTRDRAALRERRRASYYADHKRTLALAAESRKRNPGLSARWRRNNPERWAMRNRENQRRRRVRGEKVDYAAILARHGMICHLCGGDVLTLADLHFDHVIPLSKGGPHSEGNILPAHATCNLRKGAKLAA